MRFAALLFLDCKSVDKRISSPPVRLFLKRPGIVLIAVGWLQFILAASPNTDAAAPAFRVPFQAPIEFAYAPAGSVQDVQFHQFRFSGLGSSFFRPADWGCGNWDFLCTGSILALTEIWFLPSSPPQLIKCWQFVTRTALHPRAPCRA